MSIHNCFPFCPPGLSIFSFRSLLPPRTPCHGLQTCMDAMQMKQILSRPTTDNGREGGE